jgi:hypothetical protein
MMAMMVMMVVMAMMQSLFPQVPGDVHGVERRLGHAPGPRRALPATIPQVTKGDSVQTWMACVGRQSGGWKSPRALMTNTAVAIPGPESETCRGGDDGLMPHRIIRCFQSRLSGDVDRQLGDSRDRTSGSGRESPRHRLPLGVSSIP